MPRALYVVTADMARPGWTPEALEKALRIPLAKLGVATMLIAHQQGGGGLRALGEVGELDRERLWMRVRAEVDRVVLEGDPDAEATPS